MVGETLSLTNMRLRLREHGWQPTDNQNGGCLAAFYILLNNRSVDSCVSMARGQRCGEYVDCTDQESQLNAGLKKACLTGWGFQLVTHAGSTPEGRTVSRARWDKNGDCAPNCIHAVLISHVSVFPRTSHLHGSTLNQCQVQLGVVGSSRCVGLFFCVLFFFSSGRVGLFKAAALSHLQKLYLLLCVPHQSLNYN